MRSKKILLGIVTVMALVTGFSSASIVYVGSCDDLANVNDDLGINYRLTQDIDCSGSGNSIMIGADGNPFVGSFDGQGHTITVNINSSENYIGLFRSIGNASVSNLTLSGSVICTFADFEGEGNVGALAAFAYNTTIDNVHSSAYVESSIYQIGGLIGMASTVTMTDSSTSAHVVGSGGNASDIGGLIGRAQNNSVISGSYAVGDVDAGYARAGGLVGIITDSTIHTSYAAGNIYAVNGAGGLVGWSFGSTMTDTYTVADVTVRDGEAAGFIGFVDSTTVTNSYSAGVVTGTTADLGGFIGRTQGGGNSASNSFWDRDHSQMSSSVLGSSMSTVEMKDTSTFTGAGWDFDTIWGISGDLNHGYPYLLAIPPLPDDTIAPDTFILSSSASSISSDTVTFEFAANEQPSTFECSIDDGIITEDFVPCTSPYTRSSLIAGTYTFAVRAKDAADNVDLSPATVTWTISNLHVVTVSPTQGTTNVPVNSSITVVFSEPVTGDVLASIGSGPCDGSGGICPQLDAVWSSGNTVATYTRSDENFHYNTTYTIYIYGINGLDTPAMAWWSFTTAAASHGGGGGGSISKDVCSDDNSISYYDRSCGDITTSWKKFFATFSSGGVSSVSNPITVKSFVTDVFTLLHITKPIHRQTDSDTQTVPEKLVTQVIQILRRLLHK